MVPVTAAASCQEGRLRGTIAKIVFAYLSRGETRGEGKRGENDGKKILAKCSRDFDTNRNYAAIIMVHSAAEDFLLGV